MSNPTAPPSATQSTAKPSSEDVEHYISEHKLTERLQNAVNAVCRTSPDDAFGALISNLRAYAKPATVTRLVGREILDSRGNPTVEVDVYGLQFNQEKLIARGTAPSGASTGSNEALELRDKDQHRFLGKGVQKAVANVNTALSNAIKGLEIANLQAIDRALMAADGTPLKKHLGGNAVTAVSFAVAEAGALVLDLPLFQHLAAIYHGGLDKVPPKYSLPRPMVNILNGGKHAGGNLKVQEFMIVPRAGITFKEMLRSVTEVYHHLGKVLVDKYGVSAKNLGDEGGYAPSLEDPEEALALIEEAIGKAGYKVGEDVFLAIDSASSEFYSDGKYEIKKGQFVTSDELVEYYIKLRAQHPALISIEDGMSEQDYDGWKKLTARFAEECKDMILIGDDLYTTNTELIKQGIEQKWASSLLLKVNQIGTISEAMDAARMIFQEKGNVAVSHRSGETPNTLIADLAVAIGAQFIKTGATARGERVAKYNRLLQIEEMLASKGWL